MNVKLLVLSCALGASFNGFAQEGMTVVRDAETGKLRAPTAAELRAMQAKQPQPKGVSARPQSSVRTDGTRSLNLGERGLVYSVVQRAPDGSLTRRCVKDGETIIEGKEAHHDHH
jgi:hypothetical protein